ncbi:MAG: CARDB domain-containing protein, partial [Gemmataceae bacterium]
MNRLIAITGMALLTAGLIGWVALACAQPNMGKLISANDLSAEANAAESGVESGPPGSIPIQPRANAPTASPPAAAPMLAPRSAAALPGMPGLSPLPSGSSAAKGPPMMAPLIPLPMQQGAGAPLGSMPKGSSPSPALPMQSLSAGETALPMDGPAQASGGKVAPTGTVLPPLGSGSGPNGLPASVAGASAANEEHNSDMSTTSESPGSRQEPAVSLEWVGPTTAKVSQPNNYTLVVRNICNIPVQQVLVRVRIPSGLSCGDTEPKAVAEGNVLVWEVGALQPQEEKVLSMKLQAEQKGDVAPQAWVTFTGSSVMHIKVREPKLTLKVQGPPKVLLGETAAFQLAVTNPGDGSADQVKIHAVLTEGLECPRGSKIDFDIGNLAAGETRNVTVMCMTKLGGAQKCEVSADADAGLHVKETAAVSVTMPRLELQLVGPGLRYLGRKALYTIKVNNPGDAAATNVTISDLVPEGFKVLAASDGGRHDFSAHSVSWFLGELKPGETHEVKLEVQAVNPGEFKHKASAIGAHNLCAESELSTRIEGLSALMLEMVDTDDPIEVDSETSYEVRITNTGSKVETDIKLLASIPDKMEFKSATGPARFHEEGKSIVFEPLEKLAPKADAIFRI